MKPDYNEIFNRVESCFYNVFGKKYIGIVNAETSMDNIEDWDSLNYIDFVCELENEFDIEFSDTESSQMFQIQHIMRIISSIINHQPHDDIKHAFAQMQLIRKHANESCNQLVILSGSSTREGFLSLSDMQNFIDENFEFNARIYNISVSGLVIAEMLQIIEALQDIKNLRYVIGFSPIILFGCGMNEFNRSCEYERFPIDAPSMLKILSEHGYEKTSSIFPQSVEQWCQRYLAKKSLDELRYSPYKYPTLKPWNSEKLADGEAILRYYNNAPLNFAQSQVINTELLEQIFSLTTKYQNKLIFINLSLHSETLKFLEELGGMVTKTNSYIAAQVNSGRLAFIDSVKSAGINDKDFRDPGHIYKKQQQYTYQSLLSIKQHLDRKK